MLLGEPRLGRSILKSCGTRRDAESVCGLSIGYHSTHTSECRERLEAAMAADEDTAHVIKGVEKRKRDFDEQDQQEAEDKEQDDGVGRATNEPLLEGPDVMPDEQMRRM